MNDKIPNTPLAYFLFTLKPQKWSAIASVLAIILAASIEQSSSYFYKLIIDSVEANKINLVILYALLYPVVMFIVQLIYRLSALLARKWLRNSRKMTYDILTKYVLNHSHSYFSDRFAGSVMNKISNVVAALDAMILDNLWTILPSAVSFVVTFVFIMKVSISAGITFLLLLAVLYLINKKMSTKKKVYSMANAQSQTELVGKIIDMFSNVQAIRQYSRHEEEQIRVEDVTSKHQYAQNRSWVYTEIMLLNNCIVLFLFSLVMIWFLTASWRVGEIGTGDFIFIISMLAQISGSLIFIGRAFNSTAQAVGKMEEGLEDLLESNEIVDVVDAKPLEVQNATIEWNNVSFLFENKAVFTDFNLKIEHGQRLGLVGQSGAGKTTFVSLLLRQHEIPGGEILIDGQNISKVTQDSLRRAIAVVPQEPALFHRTIKENILYGNPNATEEEMIKVAKQAQAHDFIMELEKGYDTLVGERGIKLSGGQKQRVAIARAMLKDAPILILDEATSALDSESEVAIQKALECLMEGRTVIAIAHRLSTLRKMDRIIVLEQGRIIEDGNHDSLSTAGGTYEKLWNHQAGGFLVE